jgi:hypothetical protein
MDKINACLKLCDELTKAIDQAERELASKLFAQLSELAEEMPHGPPDVDDPDMVFTYVLSKLNLSLSDGGNLQTATLCVQFLQLLLMEEASSGFWGES